MLSPCLMLSVSVQHVQHLVYELGVIAEDLTSVHKSSAINPNSMNTSYLKLSIRRLIFVCCCPSLFNMSNNWCMNTSHLILSIRRLMLMFV